MSDENLPFFESNHVSVIQATWMSLSIEFAKYYYVSHHSSLTTHSNIILYNLTIGYPSVFLTVVWDGVFHLLLLIKIWWAFVPVSWVSITVLPTSFTIHTFVMSEVTLLYIITVFRQMMTFTVAAMCMILCTIFLIVSKVLTSIASFNKESIDNMMWC